MGLINDLSRAQVSFRVQGEDPGRFLVTRYRGTEGLCQLYRFEIELASTADAFAFDDVVGKAGLLSINTAFGQRWFHGVVGRFEMTGETADQTYFRAELVPGVWLLTHRYSSRIFQNKTAPQIIADVLTRGGIPADRFRLDLQRTYPEREYCVQYRETDYNFIGRLMEEEGIWWYFEQTDEAHVLVAADTPADYAPIDGEAKLDYRPPTGMKVDEEHVFRFRLGRSVRPGAVVINDFNFKNPHLDLKAQGDTERDLGLEFSDYPGEYDAKARGSERAQIRAEEFEASRTLGLGQSNCHRMAPGRTFELTEHPREYLNGQYLLTSVTHQGKQATHRSTTGTNGRLHVLDARLHQSLLAARRSENDSTRELAEGLLQIASAMKAGDPTAHRALPAWLYHAGQVSRDPAAVAGVSGGSPLEALAVPNLIEDLARASQVDFDAQVYECRFECIPAAVTFRPPRITPWPAMRGTQTARVVGPEKEEIYTDEYGRVKVQFHWDREGKFDENSSCWIRVSQGMAGGGYGMMFLPRVGQEVVVDFLEGDPDKPLITGRVYNGDHMPPYSLPEEKTKSCIKTHSSKGGRGTNEIRFEDLKDKEQILLHAQKDLHVRVKHDCVENVEHEHHLTVDANKCELIKQNKCGEVRLDFSEKIGGKKSLEVVGDVGEEFKSNYSQKVTNNGYVKVGQSLVIEAGKDITLKVGGNFIKIDGSTITILGTVVNINSGGSAGVGSLVALKAPAAPLEADKVEPGRDVTYRGGEELALGAFPTDLAGLAPPLDEIKKKTSWIEIELVDEIGQPVPYERYEIIAPDGKTIRKGALDKNGQAHESVPDPGMCEICFPDLDARAWDRIGATGATPAAAADPVSPAGETVTSQGRELREPLVAGASDIQAPERRQNGSTLQRAAVSNPQGHRLE